MPPNVSRRPRASPIVHRNSNISFLQQQNSLGPKPSLRIAVIGQSRFAVDVLHRLRQHGHVIVGVFTVADKDGREDALARAAGDLDVPLFKVKAWRRQGKTIPEVLEQYRSVGAELNVLPYCTQFIPMEVMRSGTNLVWASTKTDLHVLLLYRCLM